MSEKPKQTTREAAERMGIDVHYLHEVAANDVDDEFWGPMALCNYVAGLEDDPGPKTLADSDAAQVTCVECLKRLQEGKK